MHHGPNKTLYLRLRLYDSDFDRQTEIVTIKTLSDLKCMFFKCKEKEESPEPREQNIWNLKYLSRSIH